MGIQRTLKENRVGGLSTWLRDCFEAMVIETTRYQRKDRQTDQIRRMDSQELSTRVLSIYFQQRCKGDLVGKRYSFSQMVSEHLDNQKNELQSIPGTIYKK